MQALITANRIGQSVMYFFAIEPNLFQKIKRNMPLNILEK